MTVAIKCHMEESCGVCVLDNSRVSASCADAWVGASGVGMFFEQCDCVFGGRSRIWAGILVGNPLLSGIWDLQRRGLAVGVDSFAPTLVGSALPFHCSPWRLCWQVSLGTCQEHCFLLREPSQPTTSASNWVRLAMFCIHPPLHGRLDRALIQGQSIHRLTSGWWGGLAWRALPYLKQW